MHVACNYASPSQRGEETVLHLQRILVGVAVLHELDGVLQHAGDWDKRLDRSSVSDSPRRVVVEKGVGKRFRGGCSGTSALHAPNIAQEGEDKHNCLAI